MRRQSLTPSRQRILIGVWVAGIMVLVALFGSNCIGCKSFWLDESFSYWVAAHEGPRFWTFWDPAMPLYYLILRGWIDLFGETESALRALSVIFAVGTIPVVYMLGRKLLGPTEGIIAIGLISVNAFFIKYSQEARGYTLALMLCAFASYLFIGCVQHRRRRFWVAYGVVGTLATLAHAFSIFVLLGHVVSLAFLPSDAKPKRRIALGYALVGLLVSPLVLLLAREALQGGASTFVWIPEPNLLWVIAQSKELIGTQSRALAISYGFLACLGLGTVVSAARGRDEWTRWRHVYIVLIGLGPFLATLLLSLAIPMFVSRYLIVMLPGLTLLAIAGISALPWRAVRITIAVVVVTMATRGIVHYYSVEKEDWRTATSELLARAEPGDGVMFSAPYTAAPFMYYAREDFEEMPRVLYPDGIDPTPVEHVLGGLANPGSGASRVWLVLSHEFATERNTDGTVAILAALEERYHSVFEAEYTGIRVRLYEISGSGTSE